MLTLPPAEVVDPFAKINVWVEPDRLRVRVYILVERTLEGATTGIAIDGSGTMKPWFGAQGGGAQNKVAPIVRNMCIYLATKIDHRGITDAIYWATGEDGRQLEVIGQISADEARQYPFDGPKTYGLDTYLMPALNYFIQNQPPEASMGIYILMTDGRISDLEAVKELTTQLAQKIVSGEHVPLKLILIGIGSRIDEQQFVELDNLDTGTSQDLWDYKLAAQMDQLAEIFTEMVDRQIIVADRGVITSSDGTIVHDYRDTGLPALLEFELPANATSFSLEVNNNIITQPLNLPSTT